MRNRLVFAYNYVKFKFTRRQAQYENIRAYLKDKEYIPGNRILSSQRINDEIYDGIKSGHPLMVGRFGANELNTVRMFDFEISGKYKSILKQMNICAGFFPPTSEMGKRFTEVMINSIPKLDIIGVWMKPFEDYYLKKFGNQHLKMAYILDLEPWAAPERPWTRALQGKKVLVIHPFAKSIRTQYEKRKELFPGTDILPKFELLTLQAVQTIAGARDDRFSNWFEALEWMYQEALKVDFDIAIIGCGAYGFPLAAMLKDAGKQAIHLGGATQLLFGIKGKRWEENEAFAYVQRYFNEAWVYPSDEDKPKQAENVENGCYWK